MCVATIRSALLMMTANNIAANVSVLFGVKGGTFQTHQDSAAGTAPQSMAAGDFNQSGRPDIVDANPPTNGISTLVQ